MNNFMQPETFEEIRKMQKIFMHYTSLFCFQIPNYTAHYIQVDFTG